MVNHSDKVNIITKVYGDKINTNFDSIVDQFRSDGALYALILAQEQLTIMIIRIILHSIYFNPFSVDISSLALFGG